MPRPFLHEPTDPSSRRHEDLRDLYESVKALIGLLLPTTARETTKSGDLVLRVVEVEPGVVAIGVYEVPSREVIEEFLEHLRATGESEEDIAKARDEIYQFYQL